MIKKFLFIVIYFLHSSIILAAPIKVNVILPATLVDIDGDQNVFATPFDYYNGEIFTVHVEPSTGTGKSDINLRTVVRHGKRNKNGQWIWTDNLVEDRTIRDPWHTQASIAVDKLGYIHVAYNMHIMPWQYSVSNKPLDISSWQFRGQSITQSEIETVKFLNKTPFPQQGSAAIPGNQITYPMFFKDKLGDLYITYRYALKPAQSWEKRAFAGGIAKYDTTNQTWQSVGGPLQINNTDALLKSGELNAIQRPFAYEEGYSVYLITLAFDEKNGMHVFWHWRNKGAGMNVTHPSYAFSPDGSRFYHSNGSKYDLPINLSNAEIIANIPSNTEYYAPKSAEVLLDGSSAVVMQPLTGGRTITYLSKKSGHWSTPELTPWGASEIVIDKIGNQWLFATGLQVFKRSTVKEKWRQVGQIGQDLCTPKVKYIALENLFLVHTKTCDGKKATIISFRSQ